MRPCPHFSGRLLHSALRLLAVGCLAASGLAHALTPADAQVLATGESDERIATLNRLAVATDDKAAATLIQAMADEAVRVQGTQVLIVRDEAAVDAVTGEAVALTDEAQDVTINNRMRGAIETALAGMQLVDGDPERQREAALSLQRGRFDEPDVAQLPLIERALAADLDPKARQTLELAQAAVLLASEDEAQRLAAAQKLGETRKPEVRPLLLQRLESETSAAVKGALQSSLEALDRTLAIGSALAQAFTGISLGSILLLAALGLAITYGLMGVINMAHGELIMIGAYATWLVQAFFKSTLPDFFDWYLLAAMPVAFIAALGGTAGVFWLIDPTHHASPLFHLASGGAMLAAFFIVTDPVSGATLPRPSVLGQVHNHAQFTRVIPFNDLAALEEGAELQEVVGLVAQQRDLRAMLHGQCIEHSGAAGLGAIVHQDAVQARTEHALHHAGNGGGVVVDGDDGHGVECGVRHAAPPCTRRPLAARSSALAKPMRCSLEPSTRRMTGKRPAASSGLWT